MTESRVMTMTLAGCPHNNSTHAAARGAFVRVRCSSARALGGDPSAGKHPDAQVPPARRASGSTHAPALKLGSAAAGSTTGTATATGLATGTVAAVAGSDGAPSTPARPSSSASTSAIAAMATIASTSTMATIATIATMASTRAETAPQAGSQAGAQAACMQVCSADSCSCPGSSSCPGSRSPSSSPSCSPAALPPPSSINNHHHHHDAVPVRNDDAHDDLVNTSASDTNPPLLRLHPHRQNHPSCSLPAFRTADLLHNPRPAAASSFHAPSQQQRHHHHHQASLVQHPQLVLPSSISSNPVPVPAQQRGPSVPDHIANAKANANVQVDAAVDAGADSESAPSSARAPPASSVASSLPNSPASVGGLPCRASSCHVAQQQPATWSSPSEYSPASCAETVLVDVHQTHSSSPSSPLTPSPPSPPSPSSLGAVPLKYLSRRAPASFCTSDGPSPAPTSRRLRVVHVADQSAAPRQSAVHTLATEDGRQGQRELRLSERQSPQSGSSDEGRHSPFHRPPNSYRLAIRRHSTQPSNPTFPARVPPIRSLRSSGSRKSLTKDMNVISRPYDMGQSFAHSPEEQSQSALEGRYAQAATTSSPSFHKSDSDRQDDTGDVFLRIAREESVPRSRDDDGDDTLTSMPGLRRSSHRRPLSTATTAAYHEPTSPRVIRRLSDQQDGTWPKYPEDDQASELSRTTTFRPAINREKAASTHPGDEILRTRSGGPHLRPSLTARSAVGADTSHEGSVYARRRASITENNSTAGGRTSTYKTSSGLSHGRNHGSSPLVKAVEFQSRSGSDMVHGLEGTESTASTTAPSTVWDELDDLKSRIHRLELTGKLPSTSGAAVSRHSEERPATATTTVTTMSLSPKRQGSRQSAEVPSTTSSQKESHPILHAALMNSRPFLSSEAFQALEAAANDAMALSSMMGGPGQSGTVSGAASVVGAGGGAATDRQLRRKAESVCRSLTELCVALGDGGATQQLLTLGTSPGVAQNDGPATPTISKSYSGFLPPPRRASVAEQISPGSSSPRALSKFEERRSLILNSTAALPIMRPTSSTPNTPVESNMPRRSSLMIARTRRPGADEPDIARTPSVLRSRRAGAEDAEESRQPLSTGRSRRGTVGENAYYENNFRPPSRAATDVNMLRGQGREYPLESQAASFDSLTQNASALSRRRFLSTNLHSSRPGGSPGSNGIIPRRHLDRQPAEHDMNDDLGDIPQRHGPPLSKGIAHARASSFSTRRTRDTFMSTNSSATTGAYR
ncbi:hypothetical protein E4U55_003096 [Claviceps digitariae]|nr:hypothetical protein E4U55_003096 [Claviceps digitariae]